MPKIIYKQEIDDIELTAEEQSAAMAEATKYLKTQKIINKGKQANSRTTIAEVSFPAFRKNHTLVELFNYFREITEKVQEAIHMYPEAADKELYTHNDYGSRQIAYIVTEESDSDFQARVQKAREADEALVKKVMYTAKSRKDANRRAMLEKAAVYKQWLKENGLMDNG